MSIDPRFDGSKVRWIQGLIDPLTLTKPNPNLSTLGVESFDTWIYRHLDPSIRPLDLSTLGSTDSTLGSVDPWIHRFDLFSALLSYRPLVPSNRRSIELTPQRVCVNQPASAASLFESATTSLGKIFYRVHVLPEEPLIDDLIIKGWGKLTTSPTC